MRGVAGSVDLTAARKKQEDNITYQQEVLHEKQKDILIFNQADVQEHDQESSTRETIQLPQIDRKAA